MYWKAPKSTKFNCLSIISPRRAGNWGYTRVRASIPKITGALDELKQVRTMNELVSEAARERNDPVRSLSDVVRDMTAQVRLATVTGQQLSMERIVVASLNYKARPIGHRAIPDAHNHTFK